VVREVSSEVIRPGTSGRPALGHLFWWFLFSQGGVLTALLLPAHVLVQGILGPLGLAKVVDRHYDTWVDILRNPLVKLYLLVFFAFAFFHFAHRLRYLLVDVGLHAAKSLPGQVIFYGGAALVTLITLWILLTTAPVSFG
jgi:fumarate reductase subunit D